MVGQPTSLCCNAVCGGGVQEGTVSLRSLPVFRHFPRYPEANWALLVADSHVGGFVSVLGPCGSLQWTLLWGLVFLLPPQLPQDFTIRGFEALFPHAGTLGWAVCLTPQLFLLCSSSAQKCGNAQSASCCLATSPLHPGCPSPSLLLVWMNVSSLTPWLLDFPYSLTFWPFWLFFVLKFVLASVCCARRQSVSTYSSILAVSLSFLLISLLY